jgi:GNAT superfamily N-acetyltransferase
MTMLDIRPFQDEDRAAINEFRNRDRPAHHQSTIAEWERNDARRAAGEVSLRLCVGTPAIAYLYAVDRSTTPRRKPGVCGVTLWVAQERRNQGIGSALYDEAVKFAQARSAARIQTWLMLYAPNEPGIRFVQQRGFMELDRVVPVMLDLTAFDRAQFVSPAPDGIRFFSYAEAGDTGENRRKLYALAARIDQDVPSNDVHGEPPPFEEWQKRFDQPEQDPNALIVAADDAGEWIGISQLGFQEHSNIAWTFLTGVLREYRGQGIALALKLRTIDAAIARRCPLITTENHEDNAPMRAINKKLGFVPDAPQISYSKDMEAAE